MENKYWNRAGALQAEYDEMKNAGFEFSKAHIQLAHSYHRYYNDGDLPSWARSRWDLTQQGRWGRELNSRGEEEFERRVTARIEIEYRRFRRAHKPA